MFKHIMVPLDGSRLAEAALPATVYLAQKLHASVTLVHIVERNAPQEIHGERHLSDAAEAADYLQKVAIHAFPEDVEVKHHVHTNEVGKVARGISDHVGELSPDLIVMCAHGRRGTKERLFGNLAQQVIGLGTVPVLLIQPPESTPVAAFACSNILLPIDGDPAHEQSLSPGLELGKACAAALHLLMVIPTPGTLSGVKAVIGRLLPRAIHELLAIEQESGEEYLQQVRTRLHSTGLAVTAQVVRGDPASAILSAAQSSAADLVVLGTHGKSGLDAFWEGSVGYQVCSHCKLPVLLVPVEKFS